METSEYMSPHLENSECISRHLENNGPNNMTSKISCSPIFVSSTRTSFLSQPTPTGCIEQHQGAALLDQSDSGFCEDVHNDNIYSQVRTSLSNGHETSPGEMSLRPSGVPVPSLGGSHGEQIQAQIQAISVGHASFLQSTEEHERFLARDIPSAVSSSNPLPWCRHVFSCRPLLLSFLVILTSVLISAFTVSPRRYSETHDHILLSKHAASIVAKNKNSRYISNMTLREVLSDPSGYHLAMAPAFFGFYGYFGALAAWEQSMGRFVSNVNNSSSPLRSVAGASAGAMAAVLLAAGVPPRRAAEFVATMTLDRFADFPGILSIFRGNKFESIMAEFLREQAPKNHSLQLQDAFIPVAVSAFDIQTMSGQILRTGSMARAARASATFPFLFQPVGVERGEQDYLFIDGGVTDMAGLQGTKEFVDSFTSHRVINLKVGDFLGSPPGPSTLSETVELVSISLQNLPQCGPWAMANGPIAVEAAYQAMMASLDVPLLLGKEPNHYELHIDASKFWRRKTSVQ